MRLRRATPRRYHRSRGGAPAGYPRAVSTAARSDSDFVSAWRSAWQFLVVVGALLAVLGLVAIIYPAAATATINIMAGIFLIIAGVLLFGFAFSARDGGDVMLWIVVAVLAIVIGIVFLSAPEIGTVTLTVVLAVWFVLSGLAKLVAAYQQRGRADAGLVAINGVISLILGALIAAELPDSSDWAIGLLLGIMFLVDGAVMIALGWSLRRAGNDAVAA